MKQKRKQKKLHKQAKKALEKELLDEKIQRIPKSAKELYYEALDKATNNGDINKETNSRDYYYKSFY